MIDSFTGEYRWLSNFHLVDVVYAGVTYPSTEHAYQAAKTEDPAERKPLSDRTLPPGKAKKIGQQVTMSQNWDKIKLSVMEELLRQKFHNEDLRIKLLATGTQELVEGNSWGDRYWGVSGGRGQNNLGKILMKIRSELQAPPENWPPLGDCIHGISLEYPCLKCDPDDRD
jgi:ribA/ribD-fused uncharacterized protein